MSPVDKARTETTLIHPAAPHGRTDDRGSSTVWAIVVLTLVVAVALGAAGVGAAIVARHRAAAAADLAALAAASALGRGNPGACTEASRIAAAQGAALTACQTAGLTADVIVRVDVRGPLSFGMAAMVRARAGPPTS